MCLNGLKELEAQLIKQANLPKQTLEEDFSCILYT